MPSSENDYRGSIRPKRESPVRSTYDRCVFPSHEPVVDVANVGKVKANDPSSRMPEARTLRTSTAHQSPISVSADSA